MDNQSHSGSKLPCTKLGTRTHNQFITRDTLLPSQTSGHPSASSHDAAAEGPRRLAAWQKKPQSHLSTKLAKERQHNCRQRSTATSSQPSQSIPWHELTATIPWHELNATLHVLATNLQLLRSQDTRTGGAPFRSAKLHAWNKTHGEGPDVFIVGCTMKA